MARFSSRSGLKSMLILLIMIIGTLTIFSSGTRKVAATSDPTSYDSYQNSWFGIRPSVPRGGSFYYDQSVWSHVQDTSASKAAELGLSANIYGLTNDQNSGHDFVFLRILNLANSRVPIAYAYQAPKTPDPNTQVGYFCGANTLPVNGDDVVGGPIYLNSGTVTFFGSPGTTSGTYSNVWVSSNGFLSFVDLKGNAYPTPTSAKVAQPNAIVAPFWRDLTMDSQSKLAYSDDSYHALYVTWCNMITKATGQRVSFMVRLIYSASAQTTHDQTPIEFVYDTNVNPNDGVTTLVGLRDESGLRPLLYDPSKTALVSGGLLTAFSATTGPYYLNAISMSADPGSDSQVSLRFDPQSTSFDDSIVGVNMDTGPNPPTELIPRFIKDSMTLMSDSITVYGLLGGPSIPALEAAGVIIDGVLLVNDHAEDALNQLQNATPFVKQCTSTCPTSSSVLKVQSHVHDGFATGVDTSMGVSIIWDLGDSCKCVTHSLTISSTVYYTNDKLNSNYQSNTNSISTSVTVQLFPGSIVSPTPVTFEGGFPSTIPTGSTTVSDSGWTTGDANAFDGIQTWGAISNCPMRCYAGNSVGYVAGQQNPAGPLNKYSNNMHAYMQAYLPTLVGYSNVYLYFKAWIDVSSTDNFYVQTINNGDTVWTNNAMLTGQISDSGLRNMQGLPSQEAQVSGSSSVGGRSSWVSFRLQVDPNIRGLRFLFVSGFGPVSEGVYLDEIYLVGQSNSPGSNAWQVDVNSYLDQSSSSPPSTPPVSSEYVTIDSSTNYETPIHASLSDGTHSFTAESCIQPGPGVHWQFEKWVYLAGGVSTTSTTNSVSIPIHSDLGKGNGIQLFYQQSSGPCTGAVREFVRPNGDMSVSDWTAYGTTAKWQAVSSNTIFEGTSPDYAGASYIQASVMDIGQNKTQQFSLSSMTQTGTFAFRLWVYGELNSPSGNSVLIISVKDKATNHLLLQVVLSGPQPRAWYSSTATNFDASQINNAYIEVFLQQRTTRWDPTGTIYSIYIQDGDQVDPLPTVCRTICPV